MKLSSKLASTRLHIYIQTNDVPPAVALLISMITMSALTTEATPALRDLWQR